MPIYERAAIDTDKCDECGEPAVIKFISDEVDKDTGYRDEICFCQEHYDQKLKEAR